MIDKIYNELSKVVDPEIGFDIVSLGLIYDVKMQENKAIVTMTLSTKSCPLHELILEWVQNAVQNVIKECEINLVWEPVWNISMAKEDVRNQLR